MTIPVTGPISMTALGNEEGVPLSSLDMNGELRWLANKPDPNTAINFSDFRNKFKIRAGHVMITYTFTDGNDMDTRTRIVMPSTSQYVGWGQNNTIGDYLFFGGDNTGVGTESALINMGALSSAFGGLTKVKIDCRAQWYDRPGANPVVLSLVLWEGGTPVKSGFAWENPTAVHAATINSLGKVVSLQSTNTSSLGDRVGVLVYDVTHGTGYVDENDTNSY